MYIYMLYVYMIKVGSKRSKAAICVGHMTQQFQDIHKSSNVSVTKEQVKSYSRSLLSYSRSLLSYPLTSPSPKSR
jgi:hypothetical protein